MIFNQFGKCGFEVSLLGYGAGHIGSSEMDDQSVEYLLNAIIERGINFIDTARGYGDSERRIGKFICSDKRDKAVLCTKVGYGVDGVEDWTYDCIVKGVERALSVMETDYIDVVLLHTCPKYILERFDVVRALDDVKKRGLVRAIGYSGDNEDIEFAININEFDCFEGSFNIFDQRKSEWVIGKIKNDGKAFIAKRPIGNAPWRFNETPYGNYCEEYWHRMNKMGLDLHGLTYPETAVRFALLTDGVTTGIIGTTNIKHLDENAEYLKKGVLDNDFYYYIRRAFSDNGHSWRSEV